MVELMTVLAVVGVLLVIAVPSYSVLSMRTKLKSYANELVASVYLARGEAIKRNKPMTMCISNEDGDGCAASGNWDQGWIVMDPDPDPGLGLDPGAVVVIKHQQALSSGIRMFTVSGVPAKIDFQPSGVVSTPAIFTICQQTPDEGIEERKVTISATGRPRFETTKAGCSPP